MRRISVSEKSQRTLTKRALSRMTAMMAPATSKSDCQPQNSSVAPSKNGGVFIKVFLFPSRQLLLNTSHFQNLEIFRFIAHRAGIRNFFSKFRHDQHQHRHVER